jgi:hypothetical protein
MCGRAVRRDAGSPFCFDGWLEEVMRQSEALRPAQTVEAMVSAVRSFGKQMDDQTILVLRVL